MAEEWMSITEAAKRLTAAGDVVDRSTLSRYLKQHAEALPLKADGKANLVELGALVAHRRENIRIRGGGPAAAIAASSDAAAGASQKDGGRFDKAQIGGAARKSLAEAEMKELELAKMRGQLVPVDEIDRAMRDSISRMNSAFDRAIDSEAASLSIRFKWDERALRLALKGFSRRGVDEFHRAMLEQVDGRRRSGGLSGEQTSGGLSSAQAFEGGLQ